MPEQQLYVSPNFSGELQVEKPWVVDPELPAGNVTYVGILVVTDPLPPRFTWAGTDIGPTIYVKPSVGWFMWLTMDGWGSSPEPIQFTWGQAFQAPTYEWRGIYVWFAGGIEGNVQLIGYPA